MNHGAFRRALLVALIVTPFALGIAAGFPVCPSAGLLGIPCPGCGLTRATLAVLRGDLGAALRFHPLVFLLAPVYLGLLGLTILSYVRGTPTQRAGDPAGGPAQGPPGVLFTRTVGGIAWVTLVLVIGVWGGRFFGYFGGPAPVETYRSWKKHAHQSAPALTR